MKRIRVNNLPDAINCGTTKEFTTIPNSLLRNPEISGKAKALLCLLLSNKEGWKSYITAIKKKMKEGEDAIRSGIAELELYGYLLRIRYRDKQTKSWKGSFWAYTDVPWHFNIQDNLRQLKQNGLEIFEKQLPSENPHVETPYVENPGLKILKGKKTKDITLSDPDRSDRMISSIQSRNEKFFPLAELLQHIISTKKNIKYNHTQIKSWTNEIRKLSEMNGITYGRIKRALKWYEKNIGGQYIPVIESGYSLRMKFINLEAARDREKGTYQKTQKEQRREKAQRDLEQAVWESKFGEKE